MIKAGLRAVALAAALMMTAAPGVAQAPGPELTGSVHDFFKRRTRVAIPAYHVTYITQQQGTAVASIGARSRLNLVLTGVDEALMKRLADDAHADLVGKLKAAGFDVLPAAEARALAAGVEPVAGNVDRVAVGPSITIGKSVKIGWTAVGAAEAPLLKPFHNPGNQAMAAMQAFGATQKLGGAARKADAVALVPSLVVDFADMEAKTGADFLGRSAAGVDAALRFGLRYTTVTTAVSAYDKGAPFSGGWRLKRDYNLVGPFASVEQGGAGVRAGAGLSQVVDSNYAVRDRARGDAVVVDPAVWEGLVRQAYGAYNDALTAAAVNARG
jgi:hypothetical protein